LPHVGLYHTLALGLADSCRVVFAYASKISNNVSDYGLGPEGQQTVDSEEAAPYIFRSYDRWANNPPGIFERNPGYAHNVAIWEAARATTAAPLYFDPIKIGNRKFGDGGFGSNNPAEEMATEVACMNGYDFNDCMDLLLSIGTGDMPSINRIAKEDAPLKKYATYLNAAKKLASDARDVHERLEVRRQFYGLPYYRFNVPKDRGLNKIKLDEWKVPKWYCPSRRHTLDKIRDATEAYCNETGTRNRLKDVATILVARRNARKTHDLWPLVSRGEQYRCTFQDCKMCQRVLPRKDDLVCHLRTRHGVKEDEMKEWLIKGLCPPRSVSNGATTTNGASVINSA
jgi:Patatin-like phospholipase